MMGPFRRLAHLIDQGRQLDAALAGDPFALPAPEDRYSVRQLHGLYPRRHPGLYAPLLGSLAGAGYQGAIDAARKNILVLFAAGNDGNYNQPDVISGLAYFVPDIAPNWLSVARVAQDAASTNSVPYTISSFSSRCGYTASFCVSSPGSKIYSTVANGSDP
ncbi:S8 family serine peptidase, partial [Pseudomonas aeruginosa]|nr:S8 family serine peptidase [Pseudomonas aeruginosa]